MQYPRLIKEVQRLAGRLAMLNRFLSRLGDKCLPFFRALKRSSDFVWTPECEEAFEKLKAHLAQLAQLTSVGPDEPLSLYLAAFEHAVSSMLVWEDSGMQQSIYYTSHILNGPEERYPRSRS